MERDFDNFDLEQQNNGFGNNEPISTQNTENGTGTNETENRESMAQEQNSTYSYSFWAEQIAAASEDGQSQDGTGMDQQNTTFGGYTDYGYTASQETAAQNAYGEDHIQLQDTFEKRPKKKHTLAKCCAVVACGVIFGLGCVGIYKLVSPTKYNTTIEQNKIPETEDQSGLVAGSNEGDQKGSNSSSEGNLTDNTTSTVIAQTNTNTVQGENGVVSVVENVMPSIVKINITAPQTNYFGQTYNATGSGSGIIIKQENDKLLVVTNYHVVEDATNIDVIFSDEEAVSGEVKGYDSVADLAVLELKVSDIKAETLNTIKVATLGNSDELRVGEMAVAIGNALGYGQSVTVGYVSAKDRTVDVNGTSMVLLQTDAAINPGNSGGALLNLAGEVIGINSVKFSDEDVEGMGYAIPVSKAIPIINDLMEREVLTEEEKGYLGISGQSVDEQVSAYYNMPVGVFVNQVSEGGAADVAGIKANDIITKINDIEVTTIDALAERVNSYRKGTEITLTIKRQVNSSYEEMEVKVSLQGKETLDSLEGSTSSDDTTGNGSENDSANGNSGNGSQYPYGNGNGNGNDAYNSFPWDLFQ